MKTKRDEKGKFMKGNIPITKLNLDGEKVIKMYNKHYNINEVAKKFNCSNTPILRILKENKITPKRIIWNKGLTKEKDNRLKIHSERFLGKTTEEMYGKKKANEMKRKFIEKRRGHKVSLITREKMRSILLGRLSSLKGKTYEEIYGEEKAMKMKESKRIAKIGTKHTEDTKKKMKEARSKVIFPKKDTSIEVKIQNFLKELEIPFFTHQYIKEIEHSYQCDILIPKFNLVIECDGDYWHKYPIGREIDHVRTSELLIDGFKVLRLWESEIEVMELPDFQNKLVEIQGVSLR